MPNINTIFSYSFRCLVMAHLLCMAILLGIHHPLNPSSATTIGLKFYITIGLIFLLLVLDLATKQDFSRPRSKMVDGVLGLVWIFIVGATIIYSLSMGTL
jgi:predicted Na+-dependent transporter